MRPVSILIASVLISGLAACPGPEASHDAADAEVDLDCGDRLRALVRVPGGAYVPLADAGDGGELVLGFQGFRYLYLRAGLDADPGVSSAAVVVQLDGDAVRSQPLHLTFGPDASGVVSAPMQVFFNDDPLPTLVDRGVALELRLGARCTRAGRTILRYDPTCYEGPDGQPVCGEPDGAPDGGV
ncbi:MAG: hypothetical protein K8M05_23510 [Deltaproteobacteria bacterium]|nr:hypothetical protein [Kofleriaceae bacterium]